MSNADIGNRHSGNFRNSDVDRVRIFGNAYRDSGADFRGSISNRGNGVNDRKGGFRDRNHPFSYKTVNGEVVRIGSMVESQFVRRSDQSGAVQSLADQREPSVSLNCLTINPVELLEMLIELNGIVVKSLFF